MKKWVMLCILALLLCTGQLGCDSGGDDAEEADDDATGDDDDDEIIADYTCIPETEPDPSVCGEYPEEVGWDMGSVVTNLTFNAYYDRDCDGTPDATTMNMYRDVYCHRDTIKSIVLIAGSSCGEDEGID